MKERPIIFSGQMVKAILEDRKTMTRRPVKIISPGKDFSPIPLPIGGWEWMKPKGHLKIEYSEPFYCPHGLPGDHLWVRETWNLISGHYVYKATDSFPFSWKPAIHIPRCASRINLEIINIKVERLQEITEEDARDEGIQCEGLPHDGYFIKPFQKVWDSIYGNFYQWHFNPWVWVIEFKKI